MSKRAPSTTQLLVIAGFALSCFGILLFLWITFGGPTPFKAKPYEIEIPFKEATQLAQQSDVRISGVSVGKVQDIVLGPNGSEALAKVDIEDKYGPIPSDTRAILRTKTLLAETYIELTPGDRKAPPLPDGGTLPPAQVAESVQLDEIFRTFDPQTRAAFQTWQQEAAVAIEGRGQDLSYAFGELEPTFTQLDRVFRVLDSQRLAVKPPLPQRRHLAGGAARPPGRARRPDPQLEHGLHHHRRTRPRHRSPLPRLPHLPGRVAPDREPAEELRRRRRPGDEAARPRRRTALADPHGPFQAGAAGEGLLRRAASR